MDRERKKDIGFCLVIILSVLLLYSVSLSYPFIWDDVICIKENAFFSTSEYVKDLFTKNIFSAGSYQKIYSDALYYRPLVGLSFMADHLLWGMNPHGFRLTNILLHILCALLFYFFAKRLSFSGLLAFCAALLYAVHPAHIGSVAYISGRTDILRTFFMLLAVFAYMDGKIFPGLTFFICSLLSKEEAVMLPFVLLCIDIIINRRFSWKILPYFAFSAGYMAFRKYFLNSHDISMLEYDLSYIGTLAESVFIYARIVLFPYDLHFERFLPLVNSSSAAYFIILSLAALFFILSMVCLKRREALFSLLSLVFVFLPVSNVFPIYAGFQKSFIFMADHFLYFPLMFIILLCFSFLKIIRKRGRYLFIILYSLFLLCSVYFHYHYIRVWANEEEFYLHIIERSAYPFRAYGNLADFLSGKGDPRCLDYLEKLQQIMPDGFLYYFIIKANWYYFQEKNINKAINVFEQGIAKGVKDPNIYFSLADMYFEKSDAQKAASIFEKGLQYEKKPGYLLYFRLGFIYMKAGDKESLKKAQIYFQKSYDLKKDTQIKSYLDKTSQSLKK